MRVRVRTHVTRRPHNEEGAVVITVALLLIAIMALGALVIDVGQLVSTRRGMVRAADAAALAAAQSCALDEATMAETEADSIATANIDDADGHIVAFRPGCVGAGGGEVDVDYWTSQELSFAPILGLEDESEIGAEATAMWGAASGAATIPLMVNSDGPNFPCTSDPGACNFFYSHHDSNAVGTSNWGFLNVDTGEPHPGWPASAAANDPNRTCVNAGASTILSWIAGEPLTLNLVADPSVTPTYVCPSNGNFGTASDASQMFDALVGLKGHIRYFPVNDVTRMVADNPQKYAIVGFVPLRIVRVLEGDSEEAAGTPASSVTCPAATVEMFPAPGNVYDASSDLGYCMATYPDAVDWNDPIITIGNGNQQAEVNEDYYFDPVTETITWIFSPPKNPKPGDPPGGGGGGNPGGGGGGNPGGGGGGNPGGGGGNPGGGGGGGNQGSVVINIGYTATTPGTTGACNTGDVNDLSNSFCILTEYAGPLIGGVGPVIGGPDFGLRAIRLSEE